jgi:hypothetical protein
MFWGELVFLDVEHFAALVLSALGADGVGQAFLAAVRASGQIGGRQGIVGAAAVAATLGMLTFWMWGHTFSLMIASIAG